MRGIKHTLRALLPAAGMAFLAAGLVGTRASRAQEAGTSPPAASESAPSQQPEVERGKKLVLKDGTFQLAREYRVQGDRVHYFSLDSMQWEQLPASLVDWDATRRAEAEQAQKDQALLEKIHREEEAKKHEPVDVDASVEVAPGVFLPPGEGAFVVQGKSVLPLEQAEAGSKLSKGRLLTQILVPIPVVPSRHVISLQGARASLRVTNRTPEFYMRTADRREPQMELIRARVHGDSRKIEDLDTLFTERESRQTLPLQLWEIAKGVYRFTLGAPLDPGEYALAEIVPGEGMNLFVWDFGVDGAQAGAKQEK